MILKNFKNKIIMKIYIKNLNQDEILKNKNNFLMKFLMSHYLMKKKLFFY